MKRGDLLRELSAQGCLLKRNLRLYHAIMKFPTRFVRSSKSNWVLIHCEHSSFAS